MTLSKICTICGKEYFKNKKSSFSKFENSKFCGVECRGLGKIGTTNKSRTGQKKTEEERLKISKAKTGVKLSKEHTANIKNKFTKGMVPYNKGKKGLNTAWNKGISHMAGEKHWNYKKDRTTLKKKQERNDSAYRDWRRQVWERDGFQCQLKDETCSGKIEAHHILNWNNYINFRYTIKNGITLCHAHHPKKRAEEARLIPLFQELVALKGEIL